MKKTKLLALLVGSLSVCAFAGVMAGCSDKEDDNQGVTPTDQGNDKVIEYKPGDVIVDEKDVEFTEGGGGFSVTYTEKQIEVKYLTGNASYVSLSGTKNTEMKITGYSGELKEFSLKEIENKVKVSDAPISVSEIADCAFRDCASLEKVDLSKQNSSLSFKIGEYAFASCTSLSEVTFPDKIYVEHNAVGDSAFYNDIALQTVNLGEKFTEFGSRVFKDCTTLSQITLPSKLTSISDNMFNGCESLSSVVLPAGVKSIEDSAFKSTALTAIPFESVKDLRYIGASAFENTKITTLTVPDSVTYIGNDAFYDCARLNSVTVPFIGASINDTFGKFSTRYGMPAHAPQPFAETSDDKEDIGGNDGKEDVGNDDVDDPFTQRSLTVTVTKAISVYDEAFMDCDDVKSVKITFARGGKYKVYNSDGDTYNTVTVNVSKTIGDSAFEGCTSLVSVTVPTVDSIGAAAFKNCRSLTSYTLPEKLTAIADETFRGCKSLSAITIPGSVKSIGSNAFRNTALTTFDLKYGMNYGYAMLADCTKLTTVNIDKYDDFMTVTDDYGLTSTEYVTIGSFDNLFSVSTDLDFDNYTTSSFPLYQRSGSGSWIPKTLTKITVGQICQVPSGIASGLTSLTEVSLGFVSYLHNYNNYRYAMIGSNAFENCSNLTTFTVTGGDYVQNIGSYAFSGCSKLPDSVLDSFGELESIGNYAFKGCNAFRDVTLPASLWSSNNSYSISYNIGSNVFHNCYGMTSLTVEQYSYYYYGTHYSIDSNTSILNLFGSSQGVNESDSSYASRYYDGVPSTLTSVTLEDVIELKNSAFYGMRGIEEILINFKDAATNSSAYSYKIGSDAFSGCIALENLYTDTPDVVVTFGTDVFEHCHSLQTVEIPVYISNSSTYGVFNNMSHTEYDKYGYGTTLSPELKDITLMMPESIDTYYLGRLFYNSSSNTSSSYVPASLKTVRLVAIPAEDGTGTEEAPTFRIPSYMFRYCSEITSVTFGKEVTSIGTDAFKDCSWLTGRINPAKTNVYTYRNWVIGNTLTSTGINTKYILPSGIVGIADSAIGSYSNPKVYFLGTKAAWEKVALPTSYTDPTVYYYSQSNPTSYGPHWQYTSSTDNTPVLWTYASKTYTLNANGGMFDSDPTHTTVNVTPSRTTNADGNDSFELLESDLTTPTREGYYFAGWFTDSACTKQVSFPYYSATATTLYAKWNTYQITYSNKVTEAEGVYTLTPTSTSYNYDAFIYIEVTVDVQVTFDYLAKGQYSHDRLYAYVGSSNFDSSYYIANYTSSELQNHTVTVSAGETLYIRYHIDSYYSYNPSNAQISNIVVVAATQQG